jgi:lipopolysaccharide heptosyltransferase I
VSSVLIVRLSAIGDVVHALPALAAIKRERPETRVNWVVERGAAALLSHVRGIDKLIEIDTRSWRKQLLRSETRESVASRLGALRSERTDIALDMQGLLKSGVVAMASGAPRRIGFATSALREPASRVFLNEQVEVDPAQHVIEKNLSLVRHLGIDTSAPYEFPIEVPAEDARYVDSRLPDGPFAILNPGGGWWTKMWSAERFGALADEILEEQGLVSLVTYGPGEEELASRVVESSRVRAATAFPTSLIQFVALARRARLFVGGDTGPLHLAAACGTPIVGIYGPTSPMRNGPFSEEDVAVGREDIGCRVDCYRRTCGNWICMEIPVDAVQRAVAERLQRK